MRKILMSLLTIAIVGALIGGGVFAFFSDVETSEDNVFMAGTIDIAVDGENPLESRLAVLEDMKPCEYEEVFVTVTNVGTNPLNLWKHVGDLDCDTGAEVYPEANPVCSSEPEYVAEGGPVSWAPIDDICEWILVDLWIDVNKNGVFDEGVDVMIIDIRYERYLPDVECLWIPICHEGDVYPQQWILPPLEPEESIVIVQSYHLHEDAENEYQGDSCTFTIDYYAGQLGAPRPK